jgi:hypothetical protein
MGNNNAGLGGHRRQDRQLRRHPAAVAICGMEHAKAML